MVEMHGKFPWPEGTATTEILLSGERAGGQAKILALSAGLGALYDGLVLVLRVMAEEIHFKVLWIGRFMEGHFMKLALLNNAAIMGVGYIIGLRYASIICAGSFLSSWLLVPIIYAVGKHVPEVLAPGAVPIADMTINEVFKAYVRIIGVGGIAGAGMLGILQSLPSMVRSIGANMGAMKSQDTRERKAIPRTDRSLPTSVTAIGVVIFALAAITFFSFGLGIQNAFGFALAGTLLVIVIAFLFAPVSARAIAIVGTNPVSGMTMLTLIINRPGHEQAGPDRRQRHVRDHDGGRRGVHGPGGLGRPGQRPEDRPLAGRDAGQAVGPEVRGHGRGGRLLRLRHVAAGPAAGRLRQRQHSRAPGLGHEGDPGGPSSAPRRSRCSGTCSPWAWCSPSCCASPACRRWPSPWACTCPWRSTPRSCWAAS